MAEKNPIVNQEDSFASFNEARKTLSQQFHHLIGIVGNQVFHGHVNLDNPNMREEINKQSDLLEPEKNVLRNLYFYSCNLLASRFLLGVVGRFKAGKSTLLNALSGENISPMDTRISTGVLNFTYRSENEECIVVYDSGQEQKIEPSIKRQFVDCRFNPDNEKGVHSVQHGSPYLDLQKEIQFVDTPGLEAVNSIHEKITLDFVAQCHAAIVVSTYPPFGETELRFYERVKEVIPNIFLVQNLPADKLSAWVELEAQTLENLHKLGFYTPHKNYAGKEIRQILRKIADNCDEKELERFKESHAIHLYSVNARDAYQATMGHLFSLELQFESRLEATNTSEDLCQEFKKNGFSLSQNAPIVMQKKNEQWEIRDEANQRQYVVIKEKDNMNVYDRRQSMLPGNIALLEKSRFGMFKSDLYKFLADNKGNKLIENYLIKGRVVLDELVSMVKSKVDILQKSLAEIELQIQEQEKRKQKTNSTLLMVVDRSKLKLIESYKKLKTIIMEEDMRILLNELSKDYGENNVYRLHKEQIKSIKNRIGEFKRLFSQRHQAFMVEVQKILDESRENVLQTLENHGVLSDLQIPRTSTSLGNLELAGAGAIEDIFKIAFYGGMAYMGGSLGGGAGTALLAAPLTILGLASGPALAVGALLGGAIGLGLSFALEKHAAPLLDVCKALIGRFAHKSTRVVFDQFRSNVREKLDEIELAMVDRVINNFREEVMRTSEEFMQFFTKILQELKSKKENGLEQQEYQKLTEILEQLNNFRQQFDEFGRKQGIEENKMQGMLKGIKGFIKRFTNE